MDLTTIEKNIKKYRIEKGMKQETLAEKKLDPQLYRYAWKSG